MHDPVTLSLSNFGARLGDHAATRMARRNEARDSMQKARLKMAVLRGAPIALLLLVVGAFLLICAPSTVHVKPANGSAAAHKFGFETQASMLGLDGSAIDARTIAELDGTLWEWTGVSLELIFVRSGALQPDECRVGMGTNGGRLDRWFFRYRLRRASRLRRLTGRRAASRFSGRTACQGAAGGPHAPEPPRSCEEEL